MLPDHGGPTVILPVKVCTAARAVLSHSTRERCARDSEGLLNAFEDHVAQCLGDQAAMRGPGRNKGAVFSELVRWLTASAHRKVGAGSATLRDAAAGCRHTPSERSRSPGCRRRRRRTRSQI